jgi:hypothetical protein
MQPSLQRNEQPTRRRGPGRPFPKGVSGNPSGSHQSKRYTELRASIVGDLGELSGLEAIAVDQIVRALIRAEKAKDHALAARCSRNARDWLRDLRARRREHEANQPVPSLQELMAGDA